MIQALNKNQEELVWKNEYMNMAVKEIIKDSNTNFDSLIKNIENNEELYDFVKRIVLGNESISYIKSDTIVNLGGIYGILKEVIIELNDKQKKVFEFYC